MNDVGGLNSLKAELFQIDAALTKSPDNPTLIKQSRDHVDAINVQHAVCLENFAPKIVGRDGTETHALYMGMFDKSVRASGKATRRAPRKGARR